MAAFVELEFSNGVGLIQMVHKSLSALTKVPFCNFFLQSQWMPLCDPIFTGHQRYGPGG